MSQQVKVYRAHEFYLNGGGLKTLSMIPSVNGARIEGDDRLEFYDDGLFIYSSTDGQLDIGADTTLTITAPTITITGDIGLTGDIALADEDVSVAYQDYIYLDGDGGGEHLTSEAEGYIEVKATTGVDIKIGSTDEVQVTSSTVTLASNDLVLSAGDIKVAVGQYIYLDGGTNDYLRATTDNNVQLNGQTSCNLAVGGTTELGVSASAVTLATNNLTLTAGNISVAQQSYIYLDGQGGGECIYSSSTGKLVLSGSGSGPDDIILSGTVAVVDDMRMELGKNFSVFGEAYIYFTVPSGTEYIRSQDTHKVIIAAGGVGRDDITLSGSVSCTDTLIMGDGSLDKKVYFYDTGMYITGFADAKIRMYSDGTTYDAINLNTGSGGGVRIVGTLNVGLGVSRKLFFWDTDVYLISPTDGRLTIAANSTAADAIKLDAKVDITGAVRIGNGTLDTKVYFYDIGMYIAGVADGQMRIRSDGTGADAIHLSTGITGGVTVQYDLTVGDDLIVSGTGAFTEQLNANATLEVTGVTHLRSMSYHYAGLTTAGTSNFGGPVICSSSCGVGGVLTTNQIACNSSLGVAGPTTLNGAVVCVGNLNIGGALTMHQVVNALQLPAADPSAVGQLWVNGGVVTRSAG